MKKLLEDHGYTVWSPGDNEAPEHSYRVTGPYKAGSKWRVRIVDLATSKISTRSFPSRERATEALPRLRRGALDGSGEGYVYALVDPRFPTVHHYIGKARNISKRLAGHLVAAKDGSLKPVYAWIRGLLAEGVSPSPVEVEYCKNRVSRAEKKWIKQQIKAGHPLKNKQSVPRAQP